MKSLFSFPLLGLWAALLLAPTAASAQRLSPEQSLSSIRAPAVELPGLASSAHEVRESDRPLLVPADSSARKRSVVRGALIGAGIATGLHLALYCAAYCSGESEGYGMEILATPVVALVGAGVGVLFSVPWPRGRTQTGEPSR